MFDINLYIYIYGNRSSNKIQNLNSGQLLDDGDGCVIAEMFIELIQKKSLKTKEVKDEQAAKHHPL